MNRQLVIGGALAATVLQAGCAYVDPLVGVVKLSNSADQSPVMPQLKASITSLDEKVMSLQNKRDDTINAGRWLDIVSFGLGTVGAGAALNGNHPNAVKNLAFGTAATYGASSLFTSRDVALVYNSGITALACVSDKATALRGAVIRYGDQFGTDRNNGLPAALIQPTGCRLSKELKKKLDDAYAANGRAGLAIAYALGADLEEADRVTAATNGVVSAVNAQVLARSNNPEAVLAVISGLKTTVGGASFQSGQSAPVAVLAARTKQRECNDDVADKLTSYVNNYVAIEKRITDALNAMGALDTACTVSAAQIEPLALSQEEVTITKDAVINVVISGGRPPYTVTQVGAQTKNIGIQYVPPKTLVITGKSSIKGTEGPFKYQISDNSVVSVPKELKISTK